MSKKKQPVASFVYCIRQLRLGYAAVTNTPQISLAVSSKVSGLPMLHVGCGLTIALIFIVTLGSRLKEYSLSGTSLFSWQRKAKMVEAHDDA